jgi:hypothetical protein
MADDPVTLARSRLEATRRRLLDLSRRNRFLNYAPRRRGLEVLGEQPEAIYDILVERGRTMQFLARDEKGGATGAGLCERCGERLPPGANFCRRCGLGAPSGAAGSGRTDAAVAPTPQADAGGTPALRPDAGGTPPVPPLAPMWWNTPAESQHLDRYLQTALGGPALQSRLVKLAREAASAIQEQGYNVLYLTLGAVAWRAAEGEPANVAPLLFLPVILERKNVQSRYSLRLLDEDILTNPSLVELCQRQFGFALPVFDADGEVPVREYFRAVSEAVGHVPGWQLGPSIHLGLFSFSKLQMYRDLDWQTWPDGRSPAEHPLVQRLCGIEDAPLPAAEIPDPATLDDAVPARECYQVLDADSSQQAAILAAKRGVSMVIDGPPGTGKSQTIANIIAECLSQGRTVLFVAEKAAALEVVKRRLETVGLGDFVLELHGRKVSKALVLQELQRALAAGATPTLPAETEARELDTLRRRLNDYQRQLHTPLGGMEMSPHEALTRAVELAGEAEAVCAIPRVLDWTRPQLATALEDLRAFDAVLATVGNPAEHPWHSAGPAPAGLESRQGIEAARRGLLEAIARVQRDGAVLAQVLGVAPAVTAAGLKRQLAAARFIVAAPTMPAGSLLGPPGEVDPLVTRWLKQGAQRMRLRSLWKDFALPEAEREDWKPVLARRRAAADSGWRFLRPSWHLDGRRLRAHFIGGRLPEPVRQVQVLDALVLSSALRKMIETAAERFGPPLGAAWQGIDSDWGRLEQCAQQAAQVRGLIESGLVEPQAAGQLIASNDRKPLTDAAAALEAALAAWATAWQRWQTVTAAADNAWGGAPGPQVELNALAQRLEELA